MLGPIAHPIALWRARTHSVKRDLFAIYLALRDPRTPAAAKAVGIAIIAYVFWPIDVILDIIPILGGLDDLLVVPAGIALVQRMIPPAILEQHRADADRRVRKWRGITITLVLGTIWLVSSALTLWFVAGRL
jgi:uncharacterized membrane protein YkvA (DUF1232 family)